MTITQEQATRFCGAWSVDLSVARVVTGESRCDPPWLVERCRSQVGDYLAIIKAVVAELETKSPDDESLPFWQEAVVFWQSVLDAGEEA